MGPVLGRAPGVRHRSQVPPHARRAGPGLTRTLAPGSATHGPRGPTARASLRAITPLTFHPQRRWPVSFRLSARACLVAAFVCLQAADLICTYLLLDGGRRADVYEANPLARSILHAGGWAGVALFKL